MNEQSFLGKPQVQFREPYKGPARNGFLQVIIAKKIEDVLLTNDKSVDCHYLEYTVNSWCHCSDDTTQKAGDSPSQEQWEPILLLIGYGIAKAPREER